MAGRRIPLVFRTLSVLAVFVCSVGALLSHAQSPSPLAVDVVDVRVPAHAVHEPSPEKLGDLFMVEHRYVAALDAYNSIPDKSAVVWNKTGMAYHHLFALESARKNYEAALKLNPHYAEALNNLGAVYHGEGDYRKAEQVYRRALKYQPSAVAYCNLGTTLFAEHKFKQGIRSYQKAFSVDPKVFAPGQAAVVESGSTAEQRVAVNYSMAKVYALAGQQEQALEALRRALGAGFRDRKKLFGDQEFASLRQTAEFQRLLVDENFPLTYSKGN